MAERGWFQAVPAAEGKMASGFCFMSDDERYTRILSRHRILTANAHSSSFFTTLPPANWRNRYQKYS